MTHLDLTSLSGESLRNELSGSKKMLEDKLGTEVLTLGLPHGRFNTRVVDAAQEAGYKAVATSDYGLNSPFRQTFLWRRIPMRKSTSLNAFKAYVTGNRAFLRKEYIRTVTLRTTRKILGFKLYNSLRGMFISDK